MEKRGKEIPHPSQVTPTVGPYWVTGVQPNWRYDEEEGEIMAGDKLIARIYAYGNEPRNSLQSHDEAGNLIAAAPALLEALEALVEWDETFMASPARPLASAQRAIEAAMGYAQSRAATEATK